MNLVAVGQAGEVDNSKATTPTNLPTSTTPTTHRLLPVNPAAALRVPVNVFGTGLSCIVDTGASVTLFHKDVWKREVPARELSPWEGRQLVSVDGTCVKVLGTAKVPIRIGHVVFQHDVIVADGLTTEGILGLDFLELHRCTVDMGNRTLLCTNAGLTVQLSSEEQQYGVRQCAVYVEETIRVPPSCEMEIMAVSSATADGGSWLLEPITTTRLPIQAARALVTPANGRVPVRIVNVRTEAMTVFKGTKLACLETFNSSQVCSIEETSNLPQAKMNNVSVEKQQLLWQMVCDAEGDLTEAEADDLYNCLLCYADVFAGDSTDLGRTNITQHRIDTGDAKPIRQTPRRIPIARRHETKELLQSMLDRNIIQPSSSPWASPVVLVKKKNGALRFCADYRRLNSVTRKDAYPLPRVDDALDTLAGSRWFTTLDLLSGYWQVELHPEDKQKSAFTTHEGLFEFNVMPFGLCNAPATFQRLMDSVLAGLQWLSCLVYVDDVVIPGKSFKEHLSNLCNVLSCIRSANLKIHPSKCAVVRKKVHFLGHIISAEGIQTDPEKTSKVSSWPTPKCKREVQQFLGLANYYRRFVKNYADIAKPLHQLTEKTASFCWSEKCQQAFDELRQRLVAAPILTFPDPSKPFTLDTDASATGIGAVLSQVKEGQECVVAYASRTLSKPERRYCTTRRELLAVVTFVRQFRPYLLGTHFQVRTDHGSLSWLYNFKNPEGQLARWLEQLQEYNFSVIHRQGKRHGNADALSRMPCTQCGRTEEELLCAALHENSASDDVQNQDNANLNVDTADHDSSLSPQDDEDTYKAQLSDPHVGFVLKAKASDTYPEPASVTSKSRECQILLQQWDQLEIHDKLLWRRFHHSVDNSSHLQLIVPVSLRKILQELHAGVVSGHLGQKKTLSQLRRSFYWPGHARDVALWCRTCPVCAARKSPNPKRRASLHTISTGYPMQTVAVDILGPLPTTPSQNRYILVAEDHFTRWTEAFAIQNQEATTVAEKLVNEMFLRFSPPTQLHSDQGRQFESSVMSEVCKLLGIAKSRTTAYHPQCDGLVERHNRTLLAMLSTHTQEHPQSWDIHLPKLSFAYNSSEHASTGFSPFFLMFGREPRLPVDVMYGAAPTDFPSSSHYASELRSLLASSYQRVRDNLKAAHQRQKELYDKRVHGQPFTVGEFVWLHNPHVPLGHSRKLHCPWSGPYLVVECLSDVTYRIRSVYGKNCEQVVHFDRLKPCPHDIRLEATSQQPVDSSKDPPQRSYGEQLELLPSDDVPEHEPPAPAPADQPRPPAPPPSHYPRRKRRATERYGS